MRKANTEAVTKTKSVLDVCYLVALRAGPKPYRPNPDLYLAQLYHDHMGDSVLGVSLDFKEESTSTASLRVYAQCTRASKSPGSLKEVVI